MKKIMGLALICLATNAFAADINVRADVKTRDMKVKLQGVGLLDIQSWHEVYFNNRSDAPVTFKFRYVLCAEKWGCEVQPHEYTVNPHSEKRIDGELKRQIGYDQLGAYDYYAKTEIYGVVRDERRSDSKIAVYK